MGWWKLVVIRAYFGGYLGLLLVTVVICAVVGLGCDKMSLNNLYWDVDAPIAHPFCDHFWQVVKSTTERIRFLHQTTTLETRERSFQRLFLIRFLHQTTTLCTSKVIKIALFLIRFLHQTTTEHFGRCALVLLFLIRFLHQTTTVWANGLRVCRLFLIRFLHLTTIRLYAEGLCTYALASVRAFYITSLAKSFTIKTTPSQN